MRKSNPAPSQALRNYTLVTLAYWAFTVTDGALRMLVLLHFHALGYDTLAIASLFLFYEFFGVVTNLVGGWIGQRLGLKITLFSGLGLQVLALGMLAVPAVWLSVPYVMVAQALSGIAKDLTKMSSKSAIKLVVVGDNPSTLFKWVALLTGSKNALKGVGFFVGGLLLTFTGFRTAVLVMAGAVLVALVGAGLFLQGEIGNADKKAKFNRVFSMSPAVNRLSAARFFLFGSRDVWFVVALPIFLAQTLRWDFWQVGGFTALWVIGYGIIQALAPPLLAGRTTGDTSGSTGPDGRTAWTLALGLAIFPAGMALALQAGLNPALSIVIGLAAFGILFALNSAVHSYLILDYTPPEEVALNVGFYYMANAGGRLIGTVLSGLIYLYYGMTGCLWVSLIFVLAAMLISVRLPRKTGSSASGVERSIRRRDLNLNRKESSGLRRKKLLLTSKVRGKRQPI